MFIEFLNFWGFSEHCFKGSQNSVPGFSELCPEGSENLGLTGFSELWPRVLRTLAQGSESPAWVLKACAMVWLEPCLLVLSCSFDWSIHLGVHVMHIDVCAIQTDMVDMIQVSMIYIYWVH